MMRERAVVGGAVVAGFLASLCCVGPLIFVILGVSAFGTATAFASARPYLLGSSVLLLIVGFYGMYFRRSEQCAPGQACTAKPIGRVNRLGLWIGALAVLVFALLPYLAAPLAKIGERRILSEQNTKEECCANKLGVASDLAPDGGMTVETFKVEGMTCVSCEATIKLALVRTRGVRSAKVSYNRHEAVVEYDPKETTHDKLRDAINRTGYIVKQDR